MTIPNVSKNPELQVTKCKIHKNLDVDSKLDKLSRSYEVRLGHTGCSKELCPNKDRNESILGKIIKLRRSTTEKEFNDFAIGSNRPQATICSNYENDCQSITSSRFTTSSNSSSYCYDLAQDSFEIEQIRYARENLIRQRCEILNDPEKIRAIDFPKVRHCLRQYHIMQKIDYYSDKLYY